jgi:hypothetical protein
MAFLFFLVSSEKVSFGILIAGEGESQTFEVIEMTETRKQLVNSGGAVRMAVLPWGSPLTVVLTNDLTSNISINKTWHANCKKPDVSKILDWLVL